MPSLWRCAVSVLRSTDFRPRQRLCRIPTEKNLMQAQDARMLYATNRE